MSFAKDHQELEVWQRAFRLSRELFHLSLSFPRVEQYALSDQMRGAARSVTANIAEGWEKRRYEGAFVAKLCDSAGEAAETKDWIMHATACGYLEAEKAASLRAEYDRVLGTLHAMMEHAPEWCRKRPPAKKTIDN